MRITNAKGRILLAMITPLLFMDSAVEANPRSETVIMTCNALKEHNTARYVPNFVATMESISNQMQTNQFGFDATGKGTPDASYGLAQCHGDLPRVDCLLCYSQARTLLPGCYPFNGGHIYLDGCFMRGENYSFFHEVSSPRDKALCGNRSRKGQAFKVAALRAIGQAVVSAPKVRGYARAEAEGANNGLPVSVYVLANCWRTLNASSCRKCLKMASSLLSGCLPHPEGRAVKAGCFMRYSDINFLNAEQRNQSSKGRTLAIVIALVLSCSAVLVVGVAVSFYLRKHRRIQKKRRGTNNLKELAKVLNDSSLNFKFSVVEKATESFNDEYKLGQGGFGTVYKGVLADGREIAVKRLFFNNKNRAADFYNEVNIISSVAHKNLVRLLGCSCSGPESILIYEFVPNESLDRFIFDPDRGQQLNWEMRLEIITGTVEGLVYLHENTKVRIIHRDIKASNILLDSKFRAKLADFGLARSFQEDKSHISTAIAGTLGYMAPEYLSQGQLTEKADVYSFGVVLLEIITGRQNNARRGSELLESLVITAWEKFQQGMAEELFDPNLMLDKHHNPDLKNKIIRVVHIGLLCTQESPSLRPTMSKILEMLTKETGNLPAPTPPPFVNEETMEFNDTNESPSVPLSSSGSVAQTSHSSFYPR